MQSPVKEKKEEEKISLSEKKVEIKEKITKKNNNNILSPKKPVKKNNKKSFNISPIKKKKIDHKIKETEIKSKHKKISQKEIERQMEAFKAWENKKNEKIEKLKSEKIEKQKKLLKNNIHHNKKMSAEKNDTLLERLYFKDIKNRKEKQKLLLELYTPSFTPNIYTNSIYGAARRSHVTRKNKIRNNSMDNFFYNSNSVMEKTSNNDNFNIRPFVVDGGEMKKNLSRNKYMKVNSPPKHRRVNSQNMTNISVELETFNEEYGASIIDAIRDKLFKNKKMNRK